MRRLVVTQLRRTAVAGILLLVLLTIYQAQSDQLLSSFQIRILFNGALALGVGRRSG